MSQVLWKFQRPGASSPTFASVGRKKSTLIPNSIEKVGNRRLKQRSSHSAVRARYSVFKDVGSRLRERAVIKVGAWRTMIFHQPEALEATLEAALPGEGPKSTERI